MLYLNKTTWKINNRFTKKFCTNKTKVIQKQNSYRSYKSHKNNKISIIKNNFIKLKYLCLLWSVN